MLEWRVKAFWRLILFSLAMVIAVPSLAQAPDVFQSAPGPQPPKPRPIPHTSRPSAAEPIAPAPATVGPVPATPAPVPSAGWRHAPSGVAAPIAAEMSWNKECLPRGVPVIIAEQPTHGTLTIRDEMMPVPTVAAVGTSGVCAGKVISGKRLYYQSQPSFRGADRIAYDVQYGNGEWHRKSIGIVVE